MFSRSPPHVALLIETSRSYGRELLRGVKRYVAERGPWSIFLELRSLDSAPPPWLRSWKGDGILTRTNSAEMARQVRAVGVPTIELRSSRFENGFPFVGVDNQALVEKVIGYFRNAAFRNFAVYALDTETYFIERCELFQRAVESLGYSCFVYRQQGQSEKPSQWEKQQENIAAWVKSLPKPIAILACTDQLGFWLLDACQRVGVAVPEEVAVVGVENDATLCEMATPRLSSISLGGAEVGYAAAALLDRLMQGESAPQTATLLEPPDLVIRQSSDIVAIEDRELSAAVGFIRKNATHAISVADVLRVVPMSRSSLERKMRQTLGRSPNQEINRVRLVAAKRLLVETDLTLDQISRLCGFAHAQYFSSLFKHEIGRTPGAWRAANGGTRH